ncbi:MAG: hypothetical protein ACJ72D_17725 [Marmoricola sp.]
MVLLILGGVLVGSFLVPPTYAATKSAISNVFITNTAAHPVPVSGSLAVTNGPANPVPISGQVNVADDRQPFQTRVFYHLDDGQYFDETSFDVPAGKRLVVEFISAEARVPTGQTPVIGANTYGGAVGIPIALEQQGPVDSGSVLFTGTHQVLEFAPTGSYSFLVERGNSAGTAPGKSDGSIYVSGYLSPAS